LPASDLRSQLLLGGAQLGREFLAEVLASNSGRISSSTFASLPTAGQRFTHSMASSRDFT